MKHFALILFALPIFGEVICLPYSDAALKALQAEPTAQSGVIFGIPAIETSKAGRRMCFAHGFALEDETTGERRVSDVNWAVAKVKEAAVTAGLAAKADVAAVVDTKVRAAIKTTTALPADWSALKENETPPDLKPVVVKSAETVKVIR